MRFKRVRHTDEQITRFANGNALNGKFKQNNGY